MKPLVIALALLLAGCEPKPVEEPRLETSACLHGYWYGVSYFSHSRTVYPLFGRDGKPQPCEPNPLPR